ncbi:hypothetical protein ACI5L6_003136 [Salmonella enterica subsp. enterica serovar Anatum]
MNQNKIKPVKATVETAFGDYPRSLGAMIKETINKAFDLLETRLDGVLAIYTYWNFENNKNEAFQHFRHGPVCLNDQPHQFSLSFQLFKESIEIRLVPLNDRIDFEINDLRELVDMVFLQRAERFDMTTALVIRTNPAIKDYKLTYTVNTDGTQCFTSELVSPSSWFDIV